MGIKTLADAKIGENAHTSILENRKLVITFLINVESFNRKEVGEIMPSVSRHKCKKYLNNPDPDYLVKLSKGTKIMLLGILCEEKYDREVFGVNPVRLKQPYIDVQVVEIAS